jgi:predicted kinase
MPTGEQTGSPATKLVVIRGNSGAGKSTIAQTVRRRYGRGCALVQQDHLRRVLLWEPDRPGGLAPALIAQTVRFALDHHRHVVLEGILAAARYRDTITDLVRSHRGQSHVFYLDVSLDESLRRHATRPQAADFTGAEMRSWYLPGDVLGLDGEHVVPESSTLEQAVAYILRVSGPTPLDPDQLRQMSSLPSCGLAPRSAYRERRTRG